METVLLDFDRIKIIENHETDSVFITLERMRKLWLQRTNWHPALEIAGPDSNLEQYIHYYTVGSTLYMDARDRGWNSYKNLSEMYNRVLIKKLGWLYDRFIFELSEYLGECKYEDDLALPGFHIYEFDAAPDARKHHRCLHYDGQWFYGRNYFKEKYTNIDFRNQLSYTFTIKVPHNGAAIALWNLPDDKKNKAKSIQRRLHQNVIDRYQTLEYVKEIKDNKTIEDPWKFKLFDDDCGDLQQYMPVVIPHLEGHSFYYYGMIMHQMILGDTFNKGDFRITFQGHGLKCDGIWRLFW